MGKAILFIVLNIEISKHQTTQLFITSVRTDILKISNTNYTRFLQKNIQTYNLQSKVKNITK